MELYLSGRRTLRCLLPPASGPTATLQGTFAYPWLARASQVSFALLSAPKVDQLKISEGTYKPYKGVRGRTVGRVE